MYTYLHVVYQLEIKKKRVIYDLENLKISLVSWKTTSKFTVAQGLARVKPAPELNACLWENSLYIDPKHWTAQLPTANVC